MTVAVAATLAALLTARALRSVRPDARRQRAEPRLGRPWRHRADDATSTHYAALLDAISRRVRSGSTLGAALVDATGDAGPLSTVGEQLAGGRSLVDALATVEPVDADLALTVQALSATAHLGGPVAATLDDAAAVLRERAAARAERRAHGSQARLSARVLTIVPLAFATWNAAGSQHVRDLYVDNPIGGACAAVGLLLNLLGWRWMQKLIGPA